MSNGARESTPSSSPASHSDDSEECHSDGSLILVTKREDVPQLGAEIAAPATPPSSSGARSLAPPAEPSPITSAGLNPTSLRPGASEPAPSSDTSSLSPLSPSPYSTPQAMATTTSFSSHTSVVHSGEAGVSVPAQQALQDDSREVVGGPASGLNPSVATKVTASPVESPTSASSSSKPWYAKLATPLVGKHHGKNRRNKREGDGEGDPQAEAGSESSDEEGGDAADDDKKDQDEHAAEVLEKVDGRKEPSTPIQQQQSAPARHGLAPVAVPDRRHNADTNDSPSTAESIKDRIFEEHHPSPKVSNFKFHKLFASEIPDDDELIEDYRCALQKDVLVQGRLYLSEHYLAFKANILGSQTSVCIPFSEIVTIEKRMTALVIPNAIEVTTLNTRHVFASFLARDAAYDLLVDLWRHNHPGEERSRENKDQDSASIVSGAGGADGNNRSGDVGSEISYEDEHGERRKHKFTSALAKVGSRLKSITAVNEDKPQGKTEAEKIKDKAKKDMQGELGHEPTKYDGEEFANVALDCVLPTSPQKAYELFIHDSEFLKGFFTDDQGLKEVEIGEWDSYGDGDLQKREMSYIKPLNGSIGPKQTHCNIKDENEKVDPETYISNITTTQTPDVPAGKDFFVRTKTVTTWSNEGGARVRVTTEVEWTKTNRMLKGIIERSCIDGQKKYNQDLEKAARAHIEANPNDFKDPGVTTTNACGGSKKKGGEDDAQAFANAEGGSPLSSFLESLTGPMGIVVALVVILALTNFFTLNALRVQARAAHNARMGQPHEVASAVSRVLDQYKSVYSSTGSKSSAEVEMKSLLKVVEDLEKTAAGLVDRVKSVASML